MTNNISFTCKGHPNILGTHRNTFELTKDKEVTLKGDCIIGVACDFDGKTLADFAKQNKKFSIELSCNNETDTITANVYPNFSSEREVVIRLGEYPSERTFGVFASKSAKYLNKALIENLKSSDAVLKVTIAPLSKLSIH